jgi:hypothetical protein
VETETARRLPAEAVIDAQRPRKGNPPMPKFVVEREIPGAGQWTADQMRKASQKSVEVLTEVGPRIQWVESYVTDDKLYCVYIAPDADLIRQHASMGGFPANRILEVRAGLDPTSAER